MFVYIKSGIVLVMFALYSFCTLNMYKFGKHSFYKIIANVN